VLDLHGSHPLVLTSTKRAVLITDSLRRVRFGLSFPNFGLYSEPSALVDLAATAELAGWDGFFVWDHIVVADGMPVADPWVLLGAIGQATSTVRVGPMVAALPRHRPWVVARQAVTLDRLTGGRMILGVGIGYPAEVEFGTFGEPIDARRRADMLDEGLAIVEAVWSAEPFDFEGNHYTVKRNRFEPRAVQQPGIPIWVAGMLPNMRPLRRAARFDGVVPIRSDMRDLEPAEVAMIAGYVRAHRADDEPFDVVVGGSLQADVTAMEEAGATWFISGPGPGGEALEETTAWVSAGPPRGY
jgi:alkanesulfonate monooxygenase SsuD/methylene tetrahydromethanopterin reductase-like flavin-dependent oxidoreductase (luciferase family)